MLPRKSARLSFDERNRRAELTVARDVFRTESVFRRYKKSLHRKPAAPAIQQLVQIREQNGRPTWRLSVALPGNRRRMAPHNSAPRMQAAVPESHPERPASSGSHTRRRSVSGRDQFQLFDSESCRELVNHFIIKR